MTTPTQPNHPQSQPAARGKSRLLILLGVGAMTLLLTIGIGAFVLLRMRNNTAETPAIEMPAEAVTPTQTGPLPLGDFTFPVFPGATTPEPTLAGSMGVPPDGVGLVAANTSVAGVTDWYQTTLPTQGYTQVGVNAGVINAISPTGQPLVVNTWDMTGGGQIGIIAAVVTAPPMAEPTPAQPPVEIAPAEGEVIAPAQPMAETALPETAPEPPMAEAAPAQPMAEADVTQPLPDVLPAEGEVIAPESPTTESVQPLPESAPAAVEPATLSQAEVAPAIQGGGLPLAVSVTVSPTTIYAGTFNRLGYTLVVTGSGLVTVTANLPEGVLVHPDAFSAPGSHAYNPATHSWRWQPDLSTAAGNVLTAEFEAVNDLLHPPDSLVLKIVAQSSDPAQQPLIQAVTLESEKY